MKSLITLIVFTVATLASAKPQILTFHAGDRVPVSLFASGDLIETESDTPTYVTVKKTFYLKMTGSGTLLSFDGVDYHPYRDLLDSQVKVEASGQNPVAISMSIDARLK